jgi:hypothetical protein
MSPGPIVEEDNSKENSSLISGFQGKQQVSGNDLLLYQIDNQKIKLTETLKLYIAGV